MCRWHRCLKCSVWEFGDTTTPAAAWTGARGIPANTTTVRRHLKQWKACVGWFSRWGRTLLAIFKQPEFDLHPGGHPPVQARHIWGPTESMMWVELRLSQQEAIDLLDTHFLLWGDRENGERGCPTALLKYAYINSNCPSIKGHIFQIVYYQARRYTDSEHSRANFSWDPEVLLCNIIVVFIYSSFFFCTIYVFSHFPPTYNEISRHEMTGVDCQNTSKTTPLHLQLSASGK